MEIRDLLEFEVIKLDGSIVSYSWQESVQCKQWQLLYKIFFLNKFSTDMDKT